MNRTTHRVAAGLAACVLAASPSRQTVPAQRIEEPLPAETRDIEVPANGELKVDFKLGIKGLPKY